MPIPIYLLATPNAERRGALTALLGDATPLDGEAAPTLEGLAPGLIVADPEGLGDARLLQLVRTVADAGMGWGLVVLSPDDPETVRSVSLGPALDFAGLSEALERRGSAGEAVFDVRSVIDFVARVRHDVNNPLTSAMAETQLLLMDVEDGETRESLEVVQEQLRRIRDLMASTSHLRPRDSDS